MYRHCIFCTAALGANDALEHFPVGRSLAFDAAQGRLWAICPRCARWNLAPLEERGEAIEAAEKLFRDARVRMQSENIGLTRLPDGTGLVRVGSALPNEFAAWRYGTHMRRRYRREMVESGIARAAVTVGLVAMGPVGILGRLYAAALATLDSDPSEGFVAIKPGNPSFMAAEEPTFVQRLLDRRAGRRVVALAPREDGRIVPVRARWTRGAWLHTDELSGELAIGFPVQGRIVKGDDALALLYRLLPLLNRGGGAADNVRGAVDAVRVSGGPQAYLARRLAEGFEVGFGRRYRYPVYPLALEMALHEEQERRALEGELAGLEAMWRQAEEIAAIADRLPDGVPAPAPPRV